MSSGRSGPQQVTFQFRELTVDAQSVHPDPGPGTHDGSRLMAGPLEIPDRNIEDVTVEDGHFVIRFADADSVTRTARLIVYPRPERLLQILFYGISRRRFAARLEQAVARNQAHLARETICPWCAAKLLTLESGEWSPQVWCEYCDSLITTVPVDELGDQERNYRICPECGMYSRPQILTVAYFYFLIVHAGVHHDRVWCCSGCMRPRAWKMVAGNLPGVLGLPLAFTQLSRAYREPAARGPLRGLDTANRLLRRGRVRQALSRYSRIMERHPFSAGVLYNVAQGLIAGGDLMHARQTLQLAVENCSNYRPALEKLSQLDETTGRRGGTAPA